MVNVVAAVIIDEKGNVFIAKRNLNKSQGGLWEFPGGKIENGETEKEAIKRELYEELNIQVEAIDILGNSVFNYPDKEVNLIAILCKIINGEIMLNEHIEAKWVNVSELKELKFAPADLFIVDIVENLKNKNIS